MTTDAERLAPASWRGWRLDPEVPALVYDGPAIDGYQVDLVQLSTSAGALDWIFQIHGKPWGPSALLGFIEAVDVVLYPQGYLCQWGVDRPLTPEALRERVAKYVRTGE